jgi:hypothetical protein
MSGFSDLIDVASDYSLPCAPSLSACVHGGRTGAC